MAISKAKNSPAVISDVSLGELVERYNQALETRGLYDYDDLLQQTHQLLTHGEALRADLQGRYRYLLVDEFQDTNELQYELVKLLNATGNVLVIGDPLQSIYGFRGASAVVFDRFRSDFPSCRSITLATNYRSTPEVVALAGAVFTDGPQLTAHNRKPGRVAAVEVLNEYSEANWIVGEIERSIGGSDLLRSHQHGGSAGGRTFGDFAVLYRTHAAARPLQAALAKSGIPYQVVGEGSPYQQPAVMAVVEGLRYLAGITPAYNHQLLLEPLRGQADTLPLSQLAQAVATQCGFMAGDDETHRPIVAQFINSLVRFDTSGLAVYLDRLASIAEQEFYDSSAGAVTLLTIHAAKGLEFTRVFLIAAEEGRLPYERPGSTANVDEERRLFYVAVTRAREELDILHARMRVGEAAKVSRFVSDLPAAVLPHLVDDQLITDIRRTEKRRQKRAQGRLF